MVRTGKQKGNLRAAGMSGMSRVSGMTSFDLVERGAAAGKSTGTDRKERAEGKGNSFGTGGNGVSRLSGMIFTTSSNVANCEGGPTSMLKHEHQEGLDQGNRNERREQNERNGRMSGLSRKNCLAQVGVLWKDKFERTLWLSLTHILELVKKHVISYQPLKCNTKFNPEKE